MAEWSTRNTNTGDSVDVIGFDSYIVPSALALSRYC